MALASVMARSFPCLCRFSAAGNDSLTTRYGDRRLKSAKARSRGVLGTGWQRALWGFWYQRRPRLRASGRHAECIGWYRSRGGNPDRRTLPQLSRFGM